MAIELDAFEFNTSRNVILHATAIKYELQPQPKLSGIPSESEQLPAIANPSLFLQLYRTPTKAAVWALLLHYRSFNPWLPGAETCCPLSSWPSHSLAVFVSRINELALSEQSVTSTSSIEPFRLSPISFFQIHWQLGGSSLPRAVSLADDSCD